MTNDKMPDEIYLYKHYTTVSPVECDFEIELYPAQYDYSGGVKYIRSDLHDRRVTELLEANNRLVEENRKLKNAAQEKWQTIDSAPRDAGEPHTCGGVE